MLDFLFPKMCVGCGREGALICQECRVRLKPINGPVCPKCGRPEINGIICPECTFRNTALDRVRSGFRFEGTIRKAIHEFKYRNIRILAPVLAELMASYYHNTLIDVPTAADIIVPVPLHRKRLRERGYNQSELLAAELSPRLSLPIELNLIVRKKYTTAQARTTSVEQRRLNMIDAFACIKPAADLTIMLIDDVTTSMTTLEACAATLKRAGAKSVWALTLAREI